MENSEAVDDLNRRWKSHYNMPVTQGIVIVLQSALQAQLDQMHFIGPCLDIGTDKLMVDLMNPDLTISASEVSDGMKLFFFGSVSTVKIGSGYALTNILGIQFYVNCSAHDTLDALCPLPAWLLPVASKDEEPTFEVDETIDQDCLSSLMCKAGKN
jgi:hypothetical protein